VGNIKKKSFISINNFSFLTPTGSDAPMIKMRTWLFLCLAFLLFSHGIDAKEKNRPTICLNMIVKNETEVITRCLGSLLPVIDTWVIVDTGSSDGTQKVIKDFMASKDVPGELHERPWVNFSHNRNEALKLAEGKADFVLFIDADEYWSYEPGFALPDLDKDFYYVQVSFGGMKYGRIALIRNSLPWKWEGVLHEAITPLAGATSQTLENVFNVVTTEGARSKDPDKYKKDAELLETALLKEPNHNRYRFYLAQSYKDAGNYPLALENYQKRIDAGGWDQEVFWAMLQKAQLQEALEKPTEDVVKSYKEAYCYRSSRIEPLYHLASYCRTKGDFKAGYEVAKIAKSVPVSDDLLFLQEWMYNYGALLEFSICAYWIEKYDECRKTSLAILAKENIPDNVKECVKRNLAFANLKLFEEACSKVNFLKDESAQEPEELAKEN